MKEISVFVNGYFGYKKHASTFGVKHLNKLIFSLYNRENALIFLG